jgi:hypothetical protein
MKKTSFFIMASAAALAVSPAFAEETIVDLPIGENLVNNVYGEGFSAVAANIAINAGDVDGSIQIGGDMVNIGVDQDIVIDQDVSVEIEARRADKNVDIALESSVHLDGFVMNGFKTSAVGSVADTDVEISGSAVTESFSGSVEGTDTLSLASVVDTDASVLNVAYNTGNIDGSIGIEGGSIGVGIENLNLSTSAIGAAALSVVRVQAGSLGVN